MQERKNSDKKLDADFSYVRLSDEDLACDSKNHSVPSCGIFLPSSDEYKFTRDLSTPLMPEDSKYSIIHPDFDPYSNMANCYWSCFSYSVRAKTYNKSRYWSTCHNIDYVMCHPSEKLYTNLFYRSDYDNPDHDAVTCMCCCASNCCCGFLYLTICCIPYATAQSFGACASISTSIFCGYTLSPEEQSMDFDTYTQAKNALDNADYKTFIKIYLHNRVMRDELTTRLSEEVVESTHKLAIFISNLIRNEYKDISMQEIKQTLIYLNERGISLFGNIEKDFGRQVNKDYANIKFLMTKSGLRELDLLKFILMEGKASKLLLKQDKIALGNYFTEYLYSNEFKNQPYDYDTAKKIALILQEQGINTTHQYGPLYTLKKTNQLIQHGIFNSGITTLISEYSDRSFSEDLNLHHNP